ncbi:small nuclear ribonucleoprotein family protein [Striga asiatica]|uniref:Small nuclear ribonucleoprotein family protein n=1 Tax=Striga asiatica TaxID=4170 RepID=A0A5A7PPB7_STRAF|nr:small nuclear ribonucleoprotein family protein [Striga asiatica]
MSANADIDSQALNPEGKPRPLEAAKPTNNNPAGISRKAATKKGPVFGRTSFMATMAVPQKKKGDIRRPHSKATPANSNRAEPDSSLNRLGFTDESPLGLTTHSTSDPVPIHSISSDGVEGSISSSFSEVLLLALKLDENTRVLVLLEYRNCEEKFCFLRVMVRRLVGVAPSSRATTAVAQLLLGRCACAVLRFPLPSEDKMATGAGVETLVDQTISIITNDGRNIVGVLKGFDQATNIILDESHERVYSTKEGVQQLVLGLYIIRGDNISIVGELDEELDASLDLSKLRAHPLMPVIH